MLRNLTPAPEFELLNENGYSRSLQQLRAGRPLVLFFFRGAFCPTSRRDLMNYANTYARIRDVGAHLVAISVDDSDTLRELKARLELPFHLLSDSDFSVSRKYGIYESDETDEGPQPHGEPAVYVLDVDGNIAYSQIQSGPKGHANPAEIALVLLYMQNNGGRYWQRLLNAQSTGFSPR